MSKTVSRFAHPLASSASGEGATATTPATVLVMGSSRNLGLRVVEELRVSDQESPPRFIVAASIQPNSDDSLLKGLLLKSPPEALKVYRCNVMDSKSVAELIDTVRPDVVISTFGGGWESSSIFDPSPCNK